MNTTTSGDALVAAYLRRVDLLLDHLPRPRRQEILDGLAEHIAAARAELAGERDGDVEAILARVGTPEQIAAAEAEGSGQPVKAQAGAIEIVTLVALLAGILMLPLISLFIATGVMWFSKVWGRRDKLRVTALAAVGFLTPIAYFVIIIGAGEDGPSFVLGGVVVALLIVWLASVVVSPIVAAWLLGRHIWPLRRQPATISYDAVPPAPGPHGNQPKVWPMVQPPAVDEAALRRRRRVRNWLYAVSAVLLAGSVVALVVGIKGLVGIFPNNDAARVGAPGTASITLDEPGRYLVAHEYEPTGEAGDDGFTDPPSGSPTELTLRGPDGRSVPVQPAVGRYRYSTLNREGRSIATFTITAAGSYELTSSYPGSDGPPATLVVGRDTELPWWAFTLVVFGVLALFGALVLLAVALVVHFTAPRPPRAPGAT